MTNPKPVASIFAAKAAKELREAAQIADPFERIKAIDRITDRLRSSLPALFKGEPENGEADRNQR